MSAHQVFDADDFMAGFRNRTRRNRRHGSEAYELVFMTCCPSGLRPIDHRSRRGAGANLRSSVPLTCAGSKDPLNHC